MGSHLFLVINEPRTDNCRDLHLFPYPWKFSILVSTTGFTWSWSTSWLTFRSKFARKEPAIRLNFLKSWSHLPSSKSFHLSSICMFLSIFPTCRSKYFSSLIHCLWALLCMFNLDDDKWCMYLSHSIFLCRCIMATRKEMLKVSL